MVKGEEGREKGKNTSSNNGRVGFSLPPSLSPEDKRQRVD
jgi:hypothetical protein